MKIIVSGIALYAVMVFLIWNSNVYGMIGILIMSYIVTLLLISE